MQTKRGGTTGSEIAGGVPPIDDGVAPDNELDKADETGTAGQDLVVEDFELDKNLSKNYQLDIDNAPISIKARVRKVISPSMEEPIRVKATGYNFEFDYYYRHPYFEESLDLPIDYFLVDIAHHFLALSAQSPRNWPVSSIEKKLREKYFPETLSEISTMANMASSIIAEFREHIDERLVEVTPIDTGIIDEETMEMIKLRALQSDLGDEDFVRETIKTGKFVKYVDNKFLLKVIINFPGLVMDGAFFSNPYETLSPVLREEALQMILDGIEDVFWLAGEGRDAMSKDMAWRLRFGRALASMRLLQSWRSEVSGWLC